MLNKKPKNKVIPEDIELADIEEMSADKIKDWRDRCRAAEQTAAENLAGWQRAKADYVNLKNTAERERGEVATRTKESILLDFIQIADNFEFAFANKEAWLSAPENWRVGIEYIYATLVSVFEQHGLKEINPLGELFDPIRHHSIAVIPVNSAEQDNQVLEVLKRGYELSGRVIRPAQVKVGNYKQ